MVRRRAGHTLQDLHRVARNAAAAAVVERAPEPRLVPVVRVKVYVLVVLQALEVVVLQTGTHDALLNARLGRLRRRALVHLVLLLHVG